MALAGWLEVRLIIPICSRSVIALRPPPKRSPGAPCHRTSGAAGRCVQVNRPAPGRAPDEAFRSQRAGARTS